jgi:CBS domain containing-hemolysin-like protein
MTPLALFLLGCATVFFGTVQAAFSALMRLSLRLMAERGGRSDLLGRYLDDPLQLFIPVRLLLGFCIVAVAVLIARVTGIGNARAIAVLIVSFAAFLIVCEHLVPAIISRRDPEAVLDVVLPAFTPLTRLLRPITFALIGIIDVRRDRDSTDDDKSVESADTAPATAEPQDEGVISQQEGRELLQSIVDFTETVVREVMTPRPDIVAVRGDATLQDLRELFREQQYSRMPVYRENLDNIVGIVFVKDLVALPPTAEPPITTLMRSAYFVPESKRVSELLKEMQRRQAQMAIVVDEYGGTAGLVTVEDLLEEIVGEIRDEYDVESETVVDEGDGTFVFSGKVSVDEVRDRLGIEVEREGFETVGGYLLSHLGRMPYVGERFDVDGLEVEVLEVERRRIAKVRLRRRQDESEERGRVRLQADHE